MKSHYYCTVHNRSSNRRHCVGPGIMLPCCIVGSGIATSLNLPLPGQGITRKRRRHWRRQILKLNPRLNPAWLDAKYDVIFVGGLAPGAYTNIDQIPEANIFPVPWHQPRFEKAASSTLFTPVYERKNNLI